VVRLSICVLVALTSVGCGDDGSAASDAATVDGQPLPFPDAAIDARGPVDPLVGVGTAVAIDTSFQFVEGPVWRPTAGVLLFSDIPANTIYQLAPPSTITTFRADSGNSNGLAEDQNGLLLAAEHGNRRVSRTTGAGQVVDVASMYQGMRLNSPNDIAVRADGTLYFTDPPYGISSGEQELAFNGVFRVDPAGTLTAEWQGSTSARPNGVILSVDQSVLYVADTAGPVRAYDVAAGGALSGERTFTSDVIGADGMCLDQAGNVFVTTSTGVKAFAPDGSLWGTIAIPQAPANCTFGGTDYRTMYVTARTGVYSVSMAVPGNH